MKQLNNDNAANRSSYIGEVYNVGERCVKERVLDQMPFEWARLHREGYIHIHDLDAYGKTYNCLTFDFLRNFPYQKFDGMSDTAKIVRLFGYIKTMFADMGNEQSGGMAFANFDNEIAMAYDGLGVADTEQNRELTMSCIADFLIWCNHTHTRMGQTSYYITLNIGLARGELARFIAAAVIDCFESLGTEVFKPNIVFKVAAGYNRIATDPNYDLYRKALRCTAKKMIPTYLLCDCKQDERISPEKLSVMGCRTRVVDDLFGEKTAIGRGNIANISINLPRLALEVEQEGTAHSAAQKIAMLQQRWLAVADIVTQILLDRFQRVCALHPSDFPVNRQRQMWCVPFDEIRNVFRHGTLSIGFIGLSEAMEALTGKRFYADEHCYDAALNFVAFMREYCDRKRDEYNINFSLLATSGELISGRFLELDRRTFPQYQEVFAKGFYTNSFHVNVDSGISAREKLRKEGPFHALTNGGSISYVELSEAPIGNDEGLQELIEEGIAAGIHYFGVNFPLDRCGECGVSGVFDVCPVCGSKRVTHIRRVSGYLEILDGFTNGKKHEANTRTSN